MTTKDKLERKRNEPETQQLKRDVISFFKKTKMHPSISYKLCVDLSARICMPFYKEKRIGKREPKKNIEYAKEYIRYLINYNDMDFAKRLLDQLTQQQSQALRKIHPRPSKQIARMKSIGKNNGVWEHPIPTNYSKQKLLSFIKSKNFKKACAYLDYLTQIPQIALTKKEDYLVNEKLKDSMPKGWDWEKGDDPFVRYVDTGINPKIYRDP